MSQATFPGPLADPVGTSASGGGYDSHVDVELDSQDPVDVVLIGGGIMSATLGVLLQELEPTWTVRVVERLDAVALESSGPWNNAGTGHSALCELNYTPEHPDGTIDITSAVKVNEQFQVSRQLWSFLVESGRLPEPESFIHPVPHMSFVWGADNVDYLRRRYAALSTHPLFAGMEYSEDRDVIASWSPALVAGRPADEPIAATHITSGTDVDFGSLAGMLVDSLVERGATLQLDSEVKRIKRGTDGLWTVSGKRRESGASFSLRARFVFVGAGGGALTLLQRSGIPEIRGFGGFPVSGEFLRTDDPAVVARHQAKAYGKAGVNAPPMSVPHLDLRLVDGRPSLMFGPYAGFSPRFLKRGSLFDLFRSVRLHNVWSMVMVAVRNVSLVVYLVTQLAARKSSKFKQLREFFPDAQPGDWQRVTAGQRVQVIKKGGVLQFGTEVITASDGSIAGLLGASPGASTATPIMLDLLTRCFPDRVDAWRPTLEGMIPSYGVALSGDPIFAREVMERTAKALRLDESAGTDRPIAV